MNDPIRFIKRRTSFRSTETNYLNSSFIVSSLLEHTCMFHGLMMNFIEAKVSYCSNLLIQSSEYWVLYNEHCTTDSILIMSSLSTSSSCFKDHFITHIIKIME